MCWPSCHHKYLKISSGVCFHTKTLAKTKTSHCVLVNVNINIFFTLKKIFWNSVQFSHSVVSDSLRPHELQHARPPCPSPIPRVYSNSRPSSQWSHPTISSSVVLFSSCPQSLPESGSLPMSQLFASGGQSIGVSASASVFPMNIQDWSPLGWTGWISLQFKGLSRVFSNTTVQKYQFFSIHTVKFTGLNLLEDLIFLSCLY